LGFLKKLGDLFGSQSRPNADVYWVYARCNRCGEVLRGRIDLRNDLSVEYGESEGQTRYICRKLLSGDGSNLCFQKIELDLQFDADRNLIDQQVSGGTLVDETAYTEQHSSA
jgi:hypothetical protein